MRAKAWSIGAGLSLLLSVGAACSGSNPLSPYQRITVRVAGGGVGQGYVYANEPDVDIQCSIPAATGSQCEDTFSDGGEGGVFSLIAQPGEGSVFVGWSWATGSHGCTTVTDNTCQMTFSDSDGDLTFSVTATFQPISEGIRTP